MNEMEISEQHRKSYNEEREKRSQLEQQETPNVVNVFLDTVAEKIRIKRELVEGLRMDTQWFDAASPNEFEWVRGCPDYFGVIFSGEMNFLFFELKIKDDGEFNKTIYGGITKGGSVIAQYGCTSFYLDIVPVHRNMNEFCDNTGLPKEKFLVLFSSPKAAADNIYVISLAEINDIVDNGWNGIPIQAYGEGYGKVAYLIPKNSTRKLSTLSRDDFIALLSTNAFLPEYIY